MTNSDLLFYQSCGKPLDLTHQCMVENGIEYNEIFTIKEIIGAFEQVEIINQYGQKYIINSNQIF